MVSIESPIFVYILKLSNGKYYCGITNDRERRLREHNEGKSKSTRRYKPVKLVYSRSYESRILARKREVQIKSRGVQRFYLTQKYK